MPARPLRLKVAATARTPNLTNYSNREKWHGSLVSFPPIDVIEESSKHVSSSCYSYIDTWHITDVSYDCYISVTDV